MTARFILSLDCEGKWGVADLLDRVDQLALSDASLRRAYADIVRLLDELDVPATFAFVGLFGESANGFARLRELVEPLAARAPVYLAPALREIGEGRADGWHGDWAVDLACDARCRHEIALHGMTHVPWGSLDQAFAGNEMRLLPELSSAVGKATTFIYPRNDVAHQALLPSYGIRGYRLARPDRGRAAALLSEFNALAASDPDPEPAKGCIAIPAGRFLNWQSGLRRSVPMALSEARFRHMLDHAERTAGVAHLWLHPENVASAPATLRLLARLLRLVADRREAGRCRVLRQSDYVDERLGTSDDLHIRAAPVLAD